MKNTRSSKITLGRIFRSLGPGLTTGAADDDPSGVATYSIAGAQLGTTLLWTAWLAWPLMAAVQMLCARIGMVIDIGFAGALRAKFPRWVVDVPPLLSSAAIWSPIPPDQEIGREEAIYRRANHRLSA
jgi:Mn2+/Fe2+ NRAMP family transporter